MTAQPSSDKTKNSRIYLNVIDLSVCGASRVRS